MQRFELKRHVSRRLALGRRLGPADPRREMEITVLLHPKDEHQLREAVSSVSDPAHPLYGRLRTTEQVRRLVAPGYQDLDAVLAWLHDAGLKTEEPAGAWTVLRARGTVGAVSRLVDAPIGRFAFPVGMLPASRGPHFAAEWNPTIPAALASIVRGIAGLNDLPAARRFPVRLAPRRSRVPRRGPADSRGPGGGFTPDAVRAAYRIPGAEEPALGGAGERVGILEFGGGFAPADFDAFCEHYSLPEGNVREVSVAGAWNEFSGKSGGADVEVALDMDWARAVAPNAPLLVYWVPNDDRGWVEFLSTLLDSPEASRPSVVSISWGMPEDGFASSRRYDQTRQLFQACALLGITFLAASGDAGAADELPGAADFDGQRHVDFPAVVLEVTGVGGTRLAPGATGFSETAWNDGGRGGATGGGFSRFLRVPSWQRKAVGGQDGVTGRGVPDVSAVAAPDPGLSIRVGRKWTAAGGTSVAAPIWAGIVAHLNAARRAAGKPPLGAANAALYAAAASSSPFRDVMKGDNGFAGVTGFSAASGWDPVTGLGAPDVAKLLKKLTR